MTRKEVLERVLEIEEVKGNEEMVEVLTKMVEQVSKKRTGLTAKQKENEEIAERVYEFIAEANEPVTADYLMGKLGEGFTNQKVSALVKKLVDAGRVIKDKEGKKVVYTIAD